MQMKVLISAMGGEFEFLWLVRSSIAQTVFVNHGASQVNMC